MKNPLRWYIDRRIKKAFEERERILKIREEQEKELKRQKEAKKQVEEVVNRCVKELMSSGSCKISSRAYGTNGLYSYQLSQFQSNQHRVSTKIVEGIRKKIFDLIIARGFVESSDFYGDFIFTLSDGLRKDLQ